MPYNCVLITPNKLELLHLRKGDDVWHCFDGVGEDITATYTNFGGHQPMLTFLCDESAQVPNELAKDVLTVAFGKAWVEALKLAYNFKGGILFVGEDFDSIRKKDWKRLQKAYEKHNQLYYN